MRERILKRYDGRAPTVLDPFAGGGSLTLEALRLGCEATAMDLNPVALLTMLGVLDYPQRFANTLFPLPPRSEDEMQTVESPSEGTLVEAIRGWGRWVLEQVKPELQRFYPSEPDGGSVVAYLWAKTVRCTNPACGAEIPPVAHRWLRHRAGKTPVSIAWCLSPTGHWRCKSWKACRAAKILLKAPPRVARRVASTARRPSRPTR